MDNLQQGQSGQRLPLRCVWVSAGTTLETKQRRLQPDWKPPFCDEEVDQDMKAHSSDSTHDLNETRLEAGRRASRRRSNDVQVARVRVQQRLSPAHRNGTTRVPPHDDVGGWKKSDRGSEAQGCANTVEDGTAELRTCNVGRVWALIINERDDPAFEVLSG